MSDLVRVLNISAQIVPAIVGGENKDFGPAGTPTSARTLPGWAAKELLDAYPEKLIEASAVEDVSVQPEAVKDDGKIWIANVTGDPDEPEFIVVGVETQKDGRVVEIKERNLKRDPMVITEYLGGGQECVQAQDGSGMYNGFTHAKRPYTVYPMRRKAFPANIAKAMLLKDAQNSKWLRGRLVESRPPQKGEPTPQWSVDELRAWLIVCLGEVRGVTAAPETEAQVRDRFTKLGYSEEDIKKELFDVAQVYWNKCMKRVLNKAVPIPTAEDFRAYMKKQEERTKRAAEVASKQAAVLTK